MLRIATAACETSSTIDAAARCIAQLVAQGMDAPRYLMIQANAQHDLRAVGTAARARWPQVRVHGATSCLGSMIETGTHTGHEPGVCLLAIADADGDYGTACGALGDAPSTAAAALVRQALADADRLGETPALVWISSTPGKEEAVIAGLQEVVGASTPIVGGSAADNAIEGKWQVTSDGAAFGDGMVVSVMFPSTPIGAAFHSGYTPTALRGRITRCAGRRVFEIDGQPAADVYAGWTRGVVVRPEVGAVNILMATALWPLGRRMQAIGGTDIHLLSHPETIDADGSITLFTDMAVDDELVLMSGTTDNLLERPAMVVESACRISEIDKAQAAGMILVFCAGCMLTVNDRLDEVRRSLNDCMPGVPFIAAFTFGEQGPVLAGDNRHGNLMISVVTFARG
jgi:hypothetical protein